MSIYDEFDEPYIYDDEEGAEFGMPAIDPTEDPDLLRDELEDEGNLLEDVVGEEREIPFDRGEAEGGESA